MTAVTYEKFSEGAVIAQEALKGENQISPPPHLSASFLPFSLSLSQLTHQSSRCTKKRRPNASQCHETEIPRRRYLHDYLRHFGSKPRW